MSDDNPCPVCGAELQWVECWACGGTGVFVALHNMAGDVEMCPECGGDGGHRVCANAPHVVGSVHDGD